MKNRNAEVNQVFIYLFSIIIIVFAGFLVVKFISSFLGAAEEREDNSLYNQFNKDFYTVYTSPGSEKVYNYKVSSKVELVCFMGSEDSISSLDLSAISNEDSSILTTLYGSGDRIAAFDKDSLINSHNPKRSFVIRGDDSFCIEPQNGKFSLLFENLRNTVYVEEIDI